jgi:5'(3')-deoxyribonucleotidase
MLDASGTDKSPEDFKSWDVLDELTKEQKKEALLAMSTEEFWRGLPVMDGAKKGVRHLRNFGHQIVWVTSPWESCSGWERARRAWIREHFGDDDIVITSSKGHVQGDVFIDDKPKNVREWRKSNPRGRALLFSAPHNLDEDLTHFTWDDVGSLT